MAGVGGAAVPGRLWLAGTEARPTELFSYKNLQSMGGRAFQPGLAQVEIPGWKSNSLNATRHNTKLQLKDIEFLCHSERSGAE